MTTWRLILDALLSVVVGSVAGCVLVAAGVFTLAVVLPWSRNRDCERRRWKGPSRFEPAAPAPGRRRGG